MERRQALVRQVLVGQVRRMGSKLKPWGALSVGGGGIVKQRWGTVQLHKGHSGMCGMGWDLDRYKEAGRDSN